MAASRSRSRPAAKSSAVAKREASVSPKKTVAARSTPKDQLIREASPAPAAKRSTGKKIIDNGAANAPSTPILAQATASAVRLSAKKVVSPVASASKGFSIKNVCPFKIPSCCGPRMCFAAHAIICLVVGFGMIQLLDSYAVVSKYVEPHLKERFGERGQIWAVFLFLHIANNIVLPVMMSSQAWICKKFSSELTRCCSVSGMCSDEKGKECSMNALQNCHCLALHLTRSTALGAFLIGAVLAAIVQKVPNTVIFEYVFLAAASNMVSFFGGQILGCSCFRNIFCVAGMFSVFNLLKIAMLSK